MEHPPGTLEELIDDLADKMQRVLRANRAGRQWGRWCVIGEERRARDAVGKEDRGSVSSD